MEVSFIAFVISTHCVVLVENKQSCPAFTDNSGDKIDCEAKRGKLIQLQPTVQAISFQRRPVEQIDDMIHSNRCRRM